MGKTDGGRFYGFYGQERLVDDLDELLDQWLDEICDIPGETVSQSLDRIKQWPLKVYVHRQMDVSPFAHTIAERCLENALEILDEEHADPDGDNTEPTKKMKAAAVAFGEAITKEYRSWACEATGEVLEFTREQIEQRESIYEKSKSQDKGEK